MSIQIHGLGTATPECSIEQSVAASEAAKRLVHNGGELTSVISRLYRRTQVRRRCSVIVEGSNGNGPNVPFYPPAQHAADRGPTTEARMQRFAEDAGPLAKCSAENALSEAGLSPEEITHLITVSCTGFYAPGIDRVLVTELGLRPDVGRVQVGFMGCHGSLNGMRVAQSFVEADPNCRVLLSSVELCTLHFYYGSDAEKMVANALFADGSAALVAGKVEAREGWRIKACGSFFIPDSADAMTWKIGNHGFEMTLSPQVPELIRLHVRDWLDQWLRQHGYGIDQVNSWAIHAGGPRIIQSVAKALELPEHTTKVSNEVLGEYGNMSSATILFVIDQLRKREAKLPCVAIAFGPGLVAEAVLFE
jgi:prepilin-type processing-associated H-X9-DG protein